jgi:uncharacterized protein (UPF0335 family)
MKETAMSKDKDNDEVEKKVKEGKKSSAKATKAGNKKKLKQAADKMLNDMASSLPAGGGNLLVKSTAELDKLNAEKAKIALAVKAVRSKMKEGKIDMTAFDRIYQLRKMDEDDRRAHLASQALYAEQLNMELAPHQKAMKEHLNEKRKEAEEAMTAVHGEGTGEEAGSETVTADTGKPAAAGAVPARNEKLSASAAAVTH